MKLKDKFQIRAVCKNKGYFDEHARLYVILNEMYETGMTTEESFEVPIGDFDAWNSFLKKGMNAAFSEGYGWAELKNLKRMSRDAVYRKIHFQRYNEEVRPLVKKMTFRDILEYLLA